MVKTIADWVERDENEDVDQISKLIRELPSLNETQIDNLVDLTTKFMRIKAAYQDNEERIKELRLAALENSKYDGECEPIISRLLKFPTSHRESEYEEIIAVLDGERIRRKPVEISDTLKKFFDENRKP
jgi:hypothetical protein